MSKTTTKQHIDPKLYAELQRPTSGASIKNYVAQVFAAFTYQSFGYVMMASFLTFVYSEYLGVSSAAIAGVMSIGIIIDGITDFLMGAVTDRVRTKYGKIRHWFLWMSVPLGISIMLIYMVPASASTTIKLVYAFIMYNLFCCLLTSIRIPAAAAPTLCTQNDKVRGMMIWAGTIGNTGGTNITNWLVVPLVALFGGGLAGYRGASITMGFITIVSGFLAFMLYHEMRLDGDWEDVDRTFMKTHNREKRENVFEQFKFLLGNKWWVIYTLSLLAGGISMGFGFGCMAYYLQYVQGDMGLFGLFGTVLSIPMLVGSVVSIVLIQFIEARRLAVILYGLQAVASVCAFIFGGQGGSLTAVLVFLGIKCFCDGCIGPARGIMITRIIDYGEWKNGVRQEGLCNAGQSVMGKIGSAIATATMGFVLARLGYEGAGVMPQPAIDALDFLYLGVPAIAAVVTFLIFLFMRLDDKTSARYRKEIDERIAAATAEEA